jgi:hypothetical protein
VDLSERKERPTKNGAKPPHHPTGGAASLPVIFDAKPGAFWLRKLAVGIGQGRALFGGSEFELGRL